LASVGNGLSLVDDEACDGGRLLVGQVPVHQPVEIAQLSVRLRCADCGGPLHSVKPWRLADVLGKPIEPRD
jgi:hypothetical protein